MRNPGTWRVGLFSFTMLALCLSFGLYAFGLTEAIFRVVVPNWIIALSILRFLCADELEGR